MKGMTILLLALLMISSVSALNIEVEKIDKGSVIIAELDNPAVYEFMITNRGEADTAEIYSLVGVSMSPKGTFNLPSGRSTLEVRAYPSKETRENHGTFIFQYQIRGQNTGIFSDNLELKIVPLKDAVAIMPANIIPDQTTTHLTIKNLQNTNFDNVKFRFRSIFYDFEENVSLMPYEQKNVSVTLNPSTFKREIAGNYVVTTDITYSGARTRLESIVKYLEKEGISVNETSRGIIIRRHVTTKTNEGNVPATASIEMKKDILSRLFTTYSVEPLTADRSALGVRYSWKEDLQPGESFTVVSTTNYTLPFVLIILVILITLFVRIYLRTQLTVKKRVSFVKTKGGELALKVSVQLKANKNVQNVQLIDRLPRSTKLYERFGRKPDKVDVTSGRLSWMIGNMAAGEHRVVSYIIYTTIKVIGRFELPSATAVYEKDGKVQETHSNRTYFVSETARMED